MFGAGAACQLGVPWFVRPRPARTAILDAYQEIGVAEPRACRKCCLINQGDAALHRVNRSGEARFQRARGNLDKIAAPLLQPDQACRFMLMALSDDERSLWIVGELGCSAQAATSFQGPSGRCVAAEERYGERRRKSLQTVIQVIYQSYCTRRV